jgi:zinc transporter 1/2/3
LIPECVAGFPKGYSETFPYMIVLGGYLLIFFVEKVAFDVHIHDALHDHHVTPDSDFINGSDLNGKHQAITTTTGNRSAIILLGALAIHSILEMVSLGLAHTFGDAALLSLSIGLHQVRLNFHL